MADMSMLIGRIGGAFAADGRYGAGEPGPSSLQRALSAMDTADAPPAPSEEPLPDPLEIARAQGYAEGVAEAQALAQTENAEADQIRQRLTASFEKLDAELSETLRQRLMDTVVALCEASLAPLAIDKQALKARVERAVAMFARADDERVICMHPKDADLVRKLLPADWVFKPDPSLERGALRVEARHGGMAAGGVEDGPAQWRHAIAEALDIGHTP